MPQSILVKFCESCWLEFFSWRWSWNLVWKGHQSLGLEISLVLDLAFTTPSCFVIYEARQHDVPCTARLKDMHFTYLICADNQSWQVSKNQSIQGEKASFQAKTGWMGNFHWQIFCTLYCHVFKKRVMLKICNLPHLLKTFHYILILDQKYLNFTPRP